MPSTRITITQCSVVGADALLTAEQLAQACQSQLDWVRELAATGIVQPAQPTPADWRFGSEALAQALAARRLQQDYGANLDTVALILDLQHEVRRLKALVHSAHGMG